MDDMVLGYAGAGRFGKAVPMSDLINIAVESALGLRRSLSSNGIRQVMDFVNAVTFAGVHLQKNYRPSDESKTLAKTFLEEVDEYVELFKSDAFAARRATLMQHRIGVVLDETPSEMIVHAGLSVEGTLATVGEEYGLSRQEVVRLVTIILGFAIVAHASAEEVDGVLAEIKANIAEVASTWDRMFPADSEFELDDEDEE